MVSKILKSHFELAFAHGVAPEMRKVLLSLPDIPDPPDKKILKNEKRQAKKSAFFIFVPPVDKCST